MFLGMFYLVLKYCFTTSLTLRQSFLTSGLYSSNSQSGTILNWIDASLEESFFEGVNSKESKAIGFLKQVIIPVSFDVPLLFHEEYCN